MCGVWLRVWAWLCGCLQAQLAEASKLEEQARLKEEEEKKAATKMRTEIALNTLIPLVAPGDDRPGLLPAIVKLLERHGDDIAVGCVPVRPCVVWQCLTSWVCCPSPVSGLRGLHPEPRDGAAAAHAVGGGAHGS